MQQEHAADQRKEHLERLCGLHHGELPLAMAHEVRRAEEQERRDHAGEQRNPERLNCLRTRRHADRDEPRDRQENPERKRAERHAVDALDRGQIRWTERHHLAVAERVGHGGDEDRRQGAEERQCVEGEDVFYLKQKHADEDDARRAEVFDRDALLKQRREQ